MIRNGSGPQVAEAPRPDLQSVLEFYGTYAPHDGKYICLVHDEDNASMNVSLREGLWHCHSCGAGGDSWTLIMKKEDLDFKSAVAFVGANPDIASSADDRSSREVPAVFGRQRPGLSGRTRSPRSRAWSRPW